MIISSELLLWNWLIIGIHEIILINATFQIIKTIKE
jgi:hypothetical protein